MSWAEVKKINDDLSTPLDSLILSLRQFVPSENTLISFCSSEISIKGTGSDERVMVGSFVPELNGRVTFQITAHTRNNAYVAAIYVVEDGNTIKTIESLGQTEKTVSETFAVKRHSVYQVYGLSGGADGEGALYIKSAKINAQVADIGMKSYTVYN